MKIRTRAVAVCCLLVSSLLVLPGAHASAWRSAALDASALHGPSPRAVVGFRHAVDAGTLSRLTKLGVSRAAVLHSIDAVIVLAPRRVYVDVARLPDVEYVVGDAPIQLLNNITKRDTRVTQVRAGKAPLRRGYTGKGITVALVDSGIDSRHPDLAKSVVKHMDWSNYSYLHTLTGGAYSRDIADLPPGIDDLSHGTHVAGILAGTGVAAKGVDMSGVAPGVALLDLAIGLRGATSSYTTDYLAAYQWMIDHKNDPRFPGGIRVASNSYGPKNADESAYAPLTRIVSAAVRQGITVVFAAGNEGAGKNKVRYGPNRLPEVITVAAACKSENSCGAGKLANFSSRGPAVDIAAPGDNVYSTMTAIGPALALDEGGYDPPPAAAVDPVAHANNTAFYWAMSGTSMSTPHVAGIVALMLEANPHLTPRQVRSILTSTAEDRGPRGFDTGWGYGMVNAERAVLEAEKLAGKRSGR